MATSTTDARGLDPPSLSCSSYLPHNGMQNMQQKQPWGPGQINPPPGKVPDWSDGSSGDPLKACKSGQRLPGRSKLPTHQ